VGQIILSNVKLWAGKYDMSGKLNSIALNDDPTILDNTTFGMDAKSNKKGLDVITAALAGFWEQEPDEYFSGLGIPNVPMTIAPEPTIGGPAYSFLSQNIQYTPMEGSVGELLKFNVKSESVGTKMIRGHILENGVTARIASGSGAALLLPAPSAGQYLYGVLHVISAATSVGDTLDVIIESDDVVGFGGTPETHIAFTQALGNGLGTYQWAVPIAAGAITDTYWRTSWTIVDDDDPSFKLVVFMGII
jgi:hypothetical protein